MCNCVICFRPCQSNAESASMPRLQTLVTRPDASNRLSHVTWVFRITLRSSVSKHLRFGISTPCRNVSFASAIPSHFVLPCFPFPDLLPVYLGLTLCLLFRTLFAPRLDCCSCTWIISLPCPVGYCSLIEDPRLS